MALIITFLVVFCGICVWAWARPPAKPGEKRIIEHWLPGSGSGAGTYHQPQYREHNHNVTYEKKAKRRINLDVAGKDDREIIE